MPETPDSADGSERDRSVNVDASTLSGALPPTALAIYLALEPGLRKILSPPTSNDELGWLGHYRVLRVLGRGGMGVVFEAEDTHLQRPVALKVMLPELAENKSATERFLREARAVARLRDDHVVTMYQVGQVQETPYLAMEFLHGSTLDSRLSASQPFTLSEIVRIGRDVSSGLAAAHDAGLVHRDIKPANIWLEYRTESGRPSTAANGGTTPAFRIKILDFGLARPGKALGRITKTGTIIGTPQYMSPEQARGAEVDGRSDLFSLGVVLYRLCTDKLPFEGESMMATLTALAVEQPRPIRELNPSVPQALSDLVDRLLEKEPDRRPMSARDVVDALARIEGRLDRGHESDTSVQQVTGIHPLPAGAAPRAPAARQRFSGRSRMLVSLGLFLALAFLAPLWVPTWFRSSGKSPTGASPTVPTPPASTEPILIGALHSLTGDLKVSETPIVDAVDFAVEEINARGGVLGRRIKMVVEDGQSRSDIFAARAEKLIDKDKVVAIFGCWTSDCRKAVRAVVEKRDHLLIYPVSYEGMELSPNVIYLGSVPNQQVLPAMRWCYSFEGKKRWFLAGLDYVYSHSMHEILKDEAKSLGAQVVGESFVQMGTTDFSETTKKIADSKADLIVNTMSGDANIGFFRALDRAHLHPNDVPTLSFRVSETELSNLRVEQYAGGYLANNYLHDLERQQNREFVARFCGRFTARRHISDPMQTAYYGLYLWAQAVTKAGTTDAKAVREAFRGQRFEAPQGLVEVDPDNLHTVQQSRIGRLQLDGTIQEVFSTAQVRPRPYVSSRSREAWDMFLQQLYTKWGNRWVNPNG